jgi:hypothetical protein
LWQVDEDRIWVYPEKSLESQCAAGYDGPICGQCKSDYNHLRVGRPCDPCEDGTINVSLLLGMFFVALTAGAVLISGVYRILSDYGVITDLRLIVGFYQLLAQMNNILDITFPSPVPELMEFIKLLFLDVRNIIRLDCFDLGGFYGKAFTNVCVMPLICVLCCLLYCENLPAIPYAPARCRPCPSISSDSWAIVGVCSHEPTPNDLGGHRGERWRRLRVRHGDGLAEGQPDGGHLPALPDDHHVRTLRTQQPFLSLPFSPRFHGADCVVPITAFRSLTTRCPQHAVPGAAVPVNRGQLLPRGGLLDLLQVSRGVQLQSLWVIPTAAVR